MVMGLNSYSSMGAGNMPQYFKQKYGNGAGDFLVKPYVQPFPKGYIERETIANLKDSPLRRFLRKCFW